MMTAEDDTNNEAAARENGTDAKRTEALLNEAKEKHIAAAKALQEKARKRLLSAAASAAKLGELKDKELAYIEAAAYYREAAGLVPADEELIRADYLAGGGLACYEAGKYQEAQESLERALAIDAKMLGTKHPDVATDLNNLAALYYQLGRHEKAEMLMKRALAIREKVLGADHPDTVTVRENCAVLAEKKKEAGEQWR